MTSRTRKIKPPRAEPKQQRAVDTREQILAAVGQALDDLGYEQTGITDILDRAPCSAGSFYRFFTDKGDAVRHLRAANADRVFEAVSASVEALDAGTAASLKGNLRRLYAAMVLIHAEQPGASKIPFDSGRVISPLVDLFAPHTPLDKTTLESKIIVAVGLSAAMAKSAMEHPNRSEGIDVITITMLDELAGDA